jgi:low affinity Fe/Cu permease
MSEARHPRAGSGRNPDRSRRLSLQSGASSQADPMWFTKIFTDLASHVAHATGKPITFLLCVLTILIWAASGPYFGFSDTWQLIINTGTTIVTFLMVFLIQNTQNRDAKAVHLKLDELIRAVGGARNKLVDLEKLSDDELKALEQEFEKLRKKAEGAKDKVSELKDTAANNAR